MNLIFAAGNPEFCDVTENVVLPHPLTDVLVGDNEKFGKTILMKSLISKTAFNDNVYIIEVAAEVIG